MDNILVIVEGEKTERGFFSQITHLTNNNIHIVSYNNNIYNLYQCLKISESFDTIRMLLYGNNNIKQTDKNLLKEKLNKLPYIYLVFDFDFQNTKGKKDIQQELAKIKELLEYFTDEADGKGKLLINYPMMESYRDIQDFNDETYLDWMIDVDCAKLKLYKQEVGERGIKKRIEKFTKEEFAALVQLNLKKINYFLYNKKECPSKDEYFQTDKFSQINIYEKQLEGLHNDKKIIVLNSAVLVYLELQPQILDFHDI